MGYGFDIHGDLIAAVTEDSDCIMWDVKRASEMGRLMKKDQGRATCVRFIDGKSEGNVLGLLWAARSMMKEISWSRSL